MIDDRPTVRSVSVKSERCITTCIEMYRVSIKSARILDELP